MKKFLALLLLISCSTVSAAATQKADRVLVNKTEKKLYLYRAHKLLATYPVVFGGNPEGHKQQEGDRRTPEGRYMLDYKNPNSSYYKSIHISYPNARDVANAKRRGVSAGNMIMIHGQPNGAGWASAVTQQYNWTDGCIALSNEDMEAVWQAVNAGTPIEILP